MAAIDFPNSPSVNDTYSVGDKTWKWDGTSWNVLSPSATYAALSGASFTGNVSVAGALVGQSLRASFASATARDAAITVPVEGMLVYLEDVNQVTAYLGSAWYPVAGQMPSFVGVQTGSITAQASGASTKITLTFSSKTERGITESSGIVTVPYSGWYNVTGVVNWASGNAGNRDVILSYGVSGSYTEFSMNRIYAGVTGTNYSSVDGKVFLSAGNTLRVQGSQTSGASISMTGATIACSLTVEYLGP